MNEVESSCPPLIRVGPIQNRELIEGEQHVCAIVVSDVVWPAELSLRWLRHATIWQCATTQVGLTHTHDHEAMACQVFDES